MIWDPPVGALIRFFLCCSLSLPRFDALILWALLLTGAALQDGVGALRTYKTQEGVKRRFYCSVASAPLMNRRVLTAF